MGSNTGRKGHWNNIQDDNLDSSLGQQPHDVPTDSASATSDQDDFLLPVILVTLPVVQDAIIKVIRGQANEAKGKKILDSGEGGFVEDREV
jgi:hypothetical protein